jgi:hypothetical protein
LHAGVLRRERPGIAEHALRELRKARRVLVDERVAFAAEPDSRSLMYVA